MTRADASTRGAAIVLVAGSAAGSFALGLGHGGLATWGVWLAASAAFTGLLVSPARLPTALERWVLATLALCLLGLACVPPLWSDDLHRYLFDGMLSRQGIHPFAYAPSSPKVADLVAQLPGAINHPHLPTIYPPVAQGAFAAWTPSVLGRTGWRLALIACVALAAWGWRDAPRMGALPAWAALLLHPLVLVSVGSEGHVDALAIPIVLAVCWGLSVHRGSVVGLAVAMGVGVKLFPALWLAALPRWGRRLGGRALLVCTLALAAMSVTALPLGTKALGSLETYAETWEYNGALYSGTRAGLEGVLRLAGVEASVPRRSLRGVTTDEGPAAYYAGSASEARWESRRELASRLARLLGVAVVLGVLVLGVVQGAPPLVVMRRTTLALFAVSPVVHPWYLLWVLGFGVATRHVPSVVWCGVAMLGYVGPSLVASGLEWSSATWASAIQLSAVGLAYGFVRPSAGSAPTGESSA